MTVIKPVKVMKRIIHRISLLAVLIVAFNCAAMGQKPNKTVVNDYLVKRATEAFHANCDAVQMQPMDHAVSTVGTCDSGDEYKRVSFYSKLNCMRSECEFTRPMQLGYVDFDCAGNVIKVHCGY
jgi:hypothetical protein